MDTHKFVMRLDSCWSEAGLVTSEVHLGTGVECWRSCALPLLLRSRCGNVSGCDDGTLELSQNPGGVHVLCGVRRTADTTCTAALSRTSTKPNYRSDEGRMFM